MTKPATDRLKFNPPLGMLPALQYLLPSQLNIDQQYQRSLDTEASGTLIRSIAQHWNWDLCQPLVVARREDGQLYVIDGQHRLAAARLRGDIQQLPAVVVQYASVQDEAASFVHLNQQRKPLSRLDLFKAAVASGDQIATAIVEAVAAAGLSIAPHTNYTAWKPGMVSNVGSIEGCWRSRGARITSLALAAMGKAFTGQVLRYAGTLFPGIAGMIAVEVADLNEDETIELEVWDLLIETIAGKTQEEWRSAILVARAEDPSLRFAAASERVMIDAWAAVLGDMFEPSSAAPLESAPAPKIETAAPKVEPATPKVTPPPSRAAPSAAPAAPKVAPAVDWGRVSKAVASAGKGTASFKADDEGKAWCRQCDRRRTRGEVGNCRDPYCPFGGKA